MTQTNQANPDTQAVMGCQLDFWQALQTKDSQLLSRVLADDFVCYSPNQAPQSRAEFVATIVAMPVNVLSVLAEQIAIRLFGDIAVLAGVQVAQLALPDGSTFQERLALTNVFRKSGHAWQMVVAHPIAVAQETATRTR